MLINNEAKLITNEYALTRCARCNFCESVCPTYMVFRRRVYSPRGRIWIIMFLSQGIKLSNDEYTGLLTCLGCRACDLVCPAGIKIAEAIHDAKALLVKAALK
ncbi:(Fe-S)-binding protein [Caldivirga sp. UBA161]|uniref:(Fe-S)-binding protein n=1 Tax=Caldivirga sp. UBA161 TaxID=1915569 RepID=UPI0025C2C9BB|nr:(Fe-S)-binding protein [Caldivirga sp. UBA161]